MLASLTHFLTAMLSGFMFKKQITKLFNDLFIAFVYLPPSNSSYGKVHGNEIMQKLEKHIEYFSCKGILYLKKRNHMYLCHMMIYMNLFFLELHLTEKKCKSIWQMAS